MKNSIIVLIALFISFSTFAQQGINYKAIIKDGLGNILASQEIDVKFSIIEDFGATVVYTEDHDNIMTGANGIIILNIGEGITTDVFGDINWGSDSHSLKTEIDLDNDTNYEDLGTTAFKAVPYALNVTGLEQITENDGTQDNTGWRLKGRDSNNYGPIGNGAVDFSFTVNGTSGATGRRSFASGVDTEANGYYSTAMGINSIASEHGSIAIGTNTTASGFYSTALGFGTIASGYESMAMGEDTTASGFASLATGKFSIASGSVSTVMGFQSTASGDISTAIGHFTNAPSYAETAMGRYNTIYNPMSTDDWNDADRLFIVGNGDSTSSDAFIILKNGTITAPSFDLLEITDDKALITKEYSDFNYQYTFSFNSSNNLSISHGSSNTSISLDHLSNSGLEQISENGNTGLRIVGRNPGSYGSIGSSSVAIGTSTIASGDNSTAMGSGTYATGSSSTAMGAVTFASETFSTAMGNFTTASGRASVAMGVNTRAESYASLAVGRYNAGGGNSTGWSPSDPLFEIGNGESTMSKNNALTVLKNGNVSIGRDTPISLLEVAHENSAPTPSDYTNALSIHNKITFSSWQFHTVSNHHLSLYRNGSYRGFFHEATGAYGSISDRRVKKDITAIDNGTLNKVMQLNPVSYLMKEQTDTKRNLGLISQEVQEIFPSITHYVEEQDLLALSYTELIPILIKALQEQQDIIESQNARIDTQNTKIDTIENSMTTLSKRLENLEAINN